MDKSEMLNKLNNRRKEFLEDLSYQFSDDKSALRDFDITNLNKKGLAEKILEKHPDKTNQFFDYYTELKKENVHLNSAKSHLNKEYNISRDDLDFDTRYELLLLLYEKDLIDSEFDKIKLFSKIIRKGYEKSFTLETSLNIDNIKNKIQEFQDYWNKEQKDLNPLSIKYFKKEKSISFEIYKEYGGGKRSIDTFKFRKLEMEEPPQHPEIDKEQYYPLKNIQFKIDISENKNKIIFTKRYEKGWKNVLKEFFKFVFDIDEIFDKIESEKSRWATNIQSEMFQMLEDGENPQEYIEEKIENRKKDVIEEIEESEIGEEKQENLCKIIDTINLGGWIINEDQYLENEGPS